MTIKKKLQATIECPHCSGIIEVSTETETFTPAVPADKKVIWVAEKSTQTKLKMSQ